MIADAPSRQYREVLRTQEGSNRYPRPLLFLRRQEIFIRNMPNVLHAVRESSHLLRRRSTVKSSYSLVQQAYIRWLAEVQQLVGSGFELGCHIRSLLRSASTSHSPGYPASSTEKLRGARAASKNYCHTRLRKFQPKRRIIACSASLCAVLGVRAWGPYFAAELGVF